MTISNPTESTTLSVVFGATVAPFFWRNPSSCIELDIDWIKVIVGKDSDGHEFVVAYFDYFGMHNFMYGHLPRLPLHWHCRALCRPWVYSLKNMPNEYLVGKTPATKLIYGDFQVVFGRDSRRRQFLYVVTPRNTVFLFRNPKSRAVLPWSPACAIEVKDGMVSDSLVTFDQGASSLIDRKRGSRVELGELLASRNLF